MFDSLSDSFAGIEMRRRTTDLAIMPDELDQESVALSGYAKEAWHELLAAAVDDETAQNALRLFYRLSRQGE